MSSILIYCNWSHWNKNNKQRFAKLFFTTVVKPTRVYNNSETLIDNTYLLIGLRDISDHYSQFVLSHSPRENTHLKKRKIREYPRFAQDAFNRELLQIDWETSSSGDESFAQFYNKLSKVINLETAS